MLESYYDRFSETEVRTLLGYYKAEGTLAGEVDEVIETMKPWYDNYCFVKNKQDEQMYSFLVDEYANAKACDPDSRIESLKAEAREQLLQYAADPRTTDTLRGACLRLITLVYRTWQLATGAYGGGRTTLKTIHK